MSTDVAMLSVRGKRNIQQCIKFVQATVLIRSRFPLFQCGKTFKPDDLVYINGTEEEVEQMRTNMEHRRLQAKLEKVRIGE